MDGHYFGFILFILFCLCPTHFVVTDLFYFGTVDSFGVGHFGLDGVARTDGQADGQTGAPHVVALLVTHGLLPRYRDVLQWLHTLTHTTFATNRHYNSPTPTPTPFFTISPHYHQLPHPLPSLKLIPYLALPFNSPPHFPIVYVFFFQFSVLIYNDFPTRFLWLVRLLLPLLYTFLACVLCYCVFCGLRTFTLA